MNIKLGIEVTVLDDWYQIIIISDTFSKLKQQI